MSHFTAVYDACVLYPAPLRDFLMHLAMSNLFRAKWSDEIPSAALQAATKTLCAICYACPSISSLSLLTRLRSIIRTLAERCGQNDKKRLSFRFIVLPSSFCHFPGQ